MSPFAALNGCNAENDRTQYSIIYYTSHLMLPLSFLLLVGAIVLFVTRKKNNDEDPENEL
jgi:hypothetical protein